jgi:hypothetical protein
MNIARTLMIVAGVYGVVSLVNLVAYGLDKRAARLDRFRTPERRTASHGLARRLAGGAGGQAALRPQTPQGAVHGQGGADRQRARRHLGRGDGAFELDLLSTGITTSNGWGIAVADVDNDGDVDVDVVAKTLFENRGGADDGHWVSVKVVGDAGSNDEAIGATVAVEAGGVTGLRHVQHKTGQGCQDSSYLHMGLGETDVVDRVSVTFPGGKTVRYEGPWSADQRLLAKRERRRPHRLGAACEVARLRKLLDGAGRRAPAKSSRPYWRHQGKRSEAFGCNCGARSLSE